MNAAGVLAPSASHRGLYLESSLDPGPRVRYFRRRALFVWFGFALLGLVPSVLHWPAAARAFGLGLWFPGAGFLYGQHAIVTVITLGLFAASLAAWLIVGGFIFPLLVWSMSALLAAMAVGSTPWAPALTLVPVFTACFLTLMAWREARKLSAARHEAARIEAYLARLPLIEPGVDAPAAPGELSESDLGGLKYILDRALQPLESFDGFTTIDQFREAAWRYQLVSMNYALAALQANHVPAFRGYLVAAQRSLIRKMLDHRVWRYWRFENFVGNLRFDGDPIRRENIMYSGWWALAIGAFERATGDRQFSTAGALTLRDPSGRQYVYDYPGIVESLARNFDSDALCFFPCEPNWVFSICNLYGMTGMLLFDREHGTRFAQDRLERFNATLEREFTFADGRAVAIMSKRSGLVVASDGVLGLASNAWLVNMVSPRLAQVYWALAKRKMLQDCAGNLELHQPRGAALLDPGNYRSTGGFYWAALMASAREMGDEDIYALASRRYDELGIQNNEGAWTWKGSCYANVLSHIGRFGSRDTWHRFAWNSSVATSLNPVLESAPYPAVLVVSAKNRGQELMLVLQKGSAAPDEVTLKFGALIPHKSYQLLGLDQSFRLVADQDGYMGATIRFAGRRSLRLVPAAS